MIFTLGKIHDLIVRDLVVNVDDRGTLVEVLRTDWCEVDKILRMNSGGAVNQVYVIQNHDNSIRAFHKHQRLIDFFILVQGVAKFIFYDDRKDSPTQGTGQIVNVCDKKLQMITVPTGVFHGWRGSKGSILVSVANSLYMGVEKRGPLDEVRIPWNEFGTEIWETKFK
jgi:dTDP-4-dehydrorhamnose 3,5-epimerase